MSESSGLTPKQQRFVQEYLIDLNATQAAIRAGYSKKTARQAGADNLSKPVIAGSIQAAQKKIGEGAGITAARVLTEIWNIATADPRDLVEHKVGCCRYCWGKEFRYQRTDREFDDAKRENEHARKTLAIEKRPPPFQPQGGNGFHKNREPNPDCPECGGDGVGRTVIHDTRGLSAGAASLFAGIKETKEGIEVKVHSKDASLEKLCRHLSLFNDKMQVDATVKGSVSYRANMPARDQS